MKLPFFKKTNVSDISENSSNNVHESILNRFETEIILPKGLVAINYAFTCENGRNGDRFASKLAEEGDDVNYFAIKKGKYEVSGKTVNMQPNGQLIKNRLLAMAEKGTKFNCVLSNWSLISEDTNE